MEVGRKGCPDGKLRFCYVLSDDSCAEEALFESTEFPGARWRLCTEDDDVARTGGRGGSPDACDCTRNGRSGSATVPRSGCDFPVPGNTDSGIKVRSRPLPTHPLASVSRAASWTDVPAVAGAPAFKFCYVVEPSGCSSAIESLVVDGAAWRECDE